MNHRQKYLSACLFGIAALVGGASPAWAQTAPDLGTAANFAALGGAGVTCTNPNPPLPAVTVSGGDVGSGLDTTSVTGFPPTGTLCTLSGTIHAGDAIAAQAIVDFTTAYNTLTGITCDSAHTLSGNLGAYSPLSPGTYCISGVGLLSSQLTLNGGANGIWIFHATSSITAIGGSVVMAGGGEACNVYWQTTDDLVSLNNTDFVGNVLSGSAITFTGDGSSLVGRALAKTNVTLTGANISACEVGGRGGKSKSKCNQGVGNGTEGCDPGNSNQGFPFRSNDELIDGVPGSQGTPGAPGRQGGNN